MSKVKYCVIVEISEGTKMSLLVPKGSIGNL